MPVNHDVNRRMCIGLHEARDVAQVFTRYAEALQRQNVPFQRGAEKFLRVCVRILVELEHGSSDSSEAVMYRTVSQEAACLEFVKGIHHRRNLHVHDDGKHFSVMCLEDSQLMLEAASNSS